mmetsp:Transcript_11972/g.18946  ORF Transcript_11972/g.18946 Transcript_11972/m.18946 type:complete len:88 (-) Transcript_11972:82-345(-)
MAALSFAAGTKENDGKTGEAEKSLQLQEERAKNAPDKAMCLYCKSVPMEFETGGCGHAAACKRCAMKTATGGKCKICGQMFPNWRRI